MFGALKTFAFWSTPYIFASGVTIIGLVLVVLGASLAALGGSPLYIISGGLFLASGVQLFRGRLSALHFAALNFVFTWVWAICEVGLDGWALLPRVDLVCLLLPFYYAPPIISRLRQKNSSNRSALLTRIYLPGAAGVIALVVALVVANAGLGAHGAGPMEPRPITAQGPVDWRAIGYDAGGSRFSPLSAINRGNVGHLVRIWDYIEPVPPHVDARLARRDEATPLQVDDKLFVCLPDNKTLALDAETGHLVWRYDPHTDLTGVKSAICRGLSYYQDPNSVHCKKRVLIATLDARLIAVSADTGLPCEDFGANGQVSLKSGLGPFQPGLYYETSPPTTVGSTIIVGGLVQDNISTGEPSGVIRGFDAHTGKLIWAWDMGSPTRDSTPAPNDVYTRGTPNSWSFFSADEKLGLVYIPTGNATPDYVGSHRKQEWEKYSSSVVALEIKTGQVRWSFQMVHHDLWDYDASAQPVLFDMPTINGPVPALIEATKQGELFVLDRRTGMPLSEIKEKAVPQTDVPGERTARTQPFSVGMPSVSGPRLQEIDMWGLSPFDQLNCRAKFRSMRYEGVFTPPSLKGSIEYPGETGGVDWGGVTVDNARHLLFVPSSRMAMKVFLVPRAAAAKGAEFNDPQYGTPYAASNVLFFSRLGMPCQRPPYGLLTTIDLRTKAIAWQRPIGTAEDLGPLGIASHLPFTIGGAPMIGGAIATAGDVVFLGAVGFRRLRAIDALTGQELWSDRLPEGNQATPITYRSPKSGRQIVAIVSGNYANYREGPPLPTHVVAYALR